MKSASCDNLDEVVKDLYQTNLFGRVTLSVVTSDKAVMLFKSVGAKVDYYAIYKDHDLHFSTELAQPAVLTTVSRFSSLCDSFDKLYYVYRNYCAKDILVYPY